MSIFSPYHAEFIRALIHSDVKFIVVGGQAAVFYGVRRGTGDLDILIEPTKENGERLLQAFKGLNLEVDKIELEEFEKSLFLGLGFEPDAVDILTITPGIDFYSSFDRAIEIQEEGLTIKILAIEDLIRNKESMRRTGEKRHLDEYDVTVLKRILSDHP
ncbi:MAG: hypothetical protein JNM57_12110 [Cyclobacteriaceae bacterium]|nr:hypothetical protein [Cyclobacteriaceae bacterium]